MANFSGRICKSLFSQTEVRLDLLKLVPWRILSNVGQIEVDVSGFGDGGVGEAVKLPNR